MYYAQRFPIIARYVPRLMGFVYWDGLCFGCCMGSFSVRWIIRLGTYLYYRVKTYHIIPSFWSTGTKMNVAPDINISFNRGISG